MLLAFLQDNTGALLAVIRSYTLRLGLAQGAPADDAPTLALDILQEVAVEALDHADRFDPARQPMAWLLGIALNVIRRRRAARALRQRRELPLAGPPDFSDDSGPGDPTDRPGPHAIRFAIPGPEQATESDFAIPGPEQATESDDEARALLALVGEDDRLVLRLALLDDLDGQALAEALGVSVGTARMRLHRALARLRAAWVARQNDATHHPPDAGDPHSMPTREGDAPPTTPVTPEKGARNE